MSKQIDAMTLARDWIGDPHTRTVSAGKMVAILTEALADQPAQTLPFGVGGGLVAIKTLLSRDPCVHANTAIEMIDAILAEQPAQQEQKAQQTFAERCQLAQQLLPDAQYRAMLTKLHAEMLEALAQSRSDEEQPAQQEPVAIHQFRKRGCSDWYDGLPDYHDGHGPYEVRTLYTTPQAQPAREPLTRNEVWRNDELIRVNSGLGLLIDDLMDIVRAVEAAHGITKGNT